MNEKVPDKAPVVTSSINQTAQTPVRVNQYVLCFRCGRTGHAMGTCSAKTHIRGYAL